MASFFTPPSKLVGGIHKDSLAAMSRFIFGYVKGKRTKARDPGTNDWVSKNQSMGLRHCGCSRHMHALTIGTRRTLPPSLFFPSHWDFLFKRGSSIIIYLSLMMPWVSFICFYSLAFTTNLCIYMVAHNDWSATVVEIVVYRLSPVSQRKRAPHLRTWPFTHRDSFTHNLT